MWISNFGCVEFRNFEVRRFWLFWKFVSFETEVIVNFRFWKFVVFGSYSFVSFKVWKFVAFHNLSLCPS